MNDFMVHLYNTGYSTNVAKSCINLLQTIRAEDNGGKFSTATLNVEVADANDQAPQFVNLPYSFKVKEGLAGITVGTIKAKDEDVGRNSKIFYQVVLLFYFPLLFLQVK